MALVLANRVQETGTANTTVSFTLTGAVTGFQSFAVIGNTNTTYYSATDGSGNWEVGLGTYSTTGPTLTRTTVYASSNSNLAVTFSGAVNVFVTYPSGQSVNLDASGNVSALGTITSGTWQGTTVGVAYGGTGVTASTGPNSVVLRDANENITVNRINQGLQTTTATGGTTTLTAASDFNQALVGTGGHTFRLPDATTLSDTTTFQFNNNATGTLTIENNAGTTVGTVASGGAAGIALLSNATVGGTWDVHAYIPENVTWGTNALSLGGTVISGGTWQGGTIQSGYGGTGLTTFVGANNALYSTSASALTAGTLPVVAGGTGLTSYTLNGVVYASGTGTLATGSALTYNGTTLTADTASTSAANIRIENGSFNRVGAFQLTANGVQFDAFDQNSTSAQRSFMWLSGGSEQMRLTSTGLGIGTSSPGYKLDVRGTNPRIYLGPDTGTEFAFLQVQNTGGSAFIGLENSAGSGLSSSSPYSLNIYHGGAYPIRFSTNGGANVMVYDASGNLGIGTSSPAFGSGGGVQVKNASDSNLRLTSGSYTGFDVQQSSTGLAYLWNRDNAAMVFGTNNAERMRLDASGNLGLGVTPSTGGYGIAFQFAHSGYGGAITAQAIDTNYYPVNITANAVSSGAYTWKYANTTSSSATRYEQVSGAHRWFTAASGNAGDPISFTQAMTLDASGNLGVGHTNPSAWLYNGLSVGTGSGDTGVTVYSSIGSNGLLAFADGTSGSARYEGYIVYNHPINALTFGTQATERARIDSSGNLGVGTTSPTNYGSGYINIEAKGTGTSGGVFTSKSGGGSDARFYVVDTSGQLGTWSNIPMLFYTNSTERARIDSSGNFSMAAAGAIISSRINPRTSTTASTATLTPDIQAADQYNLTAQAVGLTVAAPIGTPVDGNKLMFRILDNGSAQTIAWNATYTAIGVTLPTATTANKMVYVGCVYNSTNTRWDVIAVTTQA